MATPLVGFADESYHGGSIVITSNSLPPVFICDLASKSKSRVVTLTERGIHQNCFKWLVSLNTSSASSCLELLLIYFSSSSFSESSSSKNCFSKILMCLFTSLSMRLISNSSLGKLSMNTVSYSSPSFSLRAFDSPPSVFLFFLSRAYFLALSFDFLLLVLPSA